MVLISCNSESINANKEQLIEVKSVEELEKDGFEMLKDFPQKAIPIFKQVAISYENQNNLKKAGQTNLNIASIYDEHSNKLDSALIYSNKSLEIWKRKNDTLQIANLYKYVGLLNGKAEKFEEAKSFISQAIKLYQDKGFEQGIAVSEFNLADVYFREKKFQESELLFNKATEFWRRKGSFSRVFTNNILGIRIYENLGKKNAVQQLINENIEIKNQNKLNGYIKNKFDELISNIK